jgi:hypothetical protein
MLREKSNCEDIVKFGRIEKDVAISDDTIIILLNQNILRNCDLYVASYHGNRLS